MDNIHHSILFSLAVHFKVFAQAPFKIDFYVWFYQLSLITISDQRHMLTKKLFKLGDHY